MEDNKKVKTILITSFHPLISRNVFASGLFNIISSKARVVILVPDFKADFFKNEFAGYNVIVESVKKKQLKKLDIYFIWLFLSLLNTDSMKFKRKEKLNKDKKYLTYCASSLIAFFFGRSKLVKRAARLADFYLRQSDELFNYYFDKYNPCLVFLTDILHEYDAALAKAARRRKIKFIGMIRSWDNLTCKGIIKTVPDKLIVGNEPLKRAAVKYHNIKSDDISVVGIPHYDNYSGPPKKSREEFFKELGFDLDKKTVLLAPVGNRYIVNNKTDRAVLDALSELDLNILVRIPPGDMVDFGDFAERKAKVFFDNTGTQFKGRTAKNNEMSRHDDIHLITSFYWADAVVTGPSTVCIDAAVFNKPIIFINFDDKKRKYSDSVSRYYNYNHFKPIVKSKGVKLANSPDELKSLVEIYLKNPALDSEKRKIIAKEQAYLLDGQSTKRLADILLLYL